MIEIVNLTPFEISVMRADSSKLTLPPSGQVASVVESNVLEDEPIAGVYIGSIQMIGVEGLPDERAGVFYVVHPLVAEAAYHTMPQRSDLLVPGGVRRDAIGPDVPLHGLNRWRPAYSYRGARDAMRQLGAEHAYLSMGYLIPNTAPDDRAMDLVADLVAELVCAIAPAPAEGSNLSIAIDSLSKMSSVMQLAHRRDVERATTEALELRKEADEARAAMRHAQDLARATAGLREDIAAARADLTDLGEPSKE